MHLELVHTGAWSMCVFAILKYQDVSILGEQRAFWKKKICKLVFHLISFTNPFNRFLVVDKQQLSK